MLKTSFSNKQNLSEFFLPLSALHRAGPFISKALTKLVGGDRIFDLLLHRPMRAENISLCPRLFEVQNDELIIVKAKVESHVQPATKRQPYKVICHNSSGFISLIFFKIFPSQIAKMVVGSEIAILGNLTRIAGENKIVHPHEILPVLEIEKLPKINVVYPLCAGVTQKFLNQKIRQVLAKNIICEEWINEELLKKQGWMGFFEALRFLHYFNNSASEKNILARQRLAYDELLAWQIATLIAKEAAQKNKNFILPSKDLSEDFLNELPFSPTNSQLGAINEIRGEIFSSKKMLRILQGDVGSGKTIVAISACLQAISKNKQACVIAPTTVLAKQHLSYFAKFLEKFGARIELLTSANTKKQKEKILRDLADGKIDILISTHAVLEDDVMFKDLGLAVIDEQHRFGVMQRLKLYNKGGDVDVLLMSATPIPRSLMMALYGDMDISILSEKPKNRQEISTLIMSCEKIADNYESLRRATAKGEKVYWICPAIDEENEVELASVTKRFNELVKIFGDENVVLLHGKMSEKEKENAMREFAFGDKKIMVATTVIEVGIDVSDATVILIEDAQNFGLAQLHQLRGRVGRGEKKSFCILLYGKKFGGNGRQRLEILRNSNDGFFIAEEDLKMRGSGDLVGTRQSGFPEFKIADLTFDSDLLKIANKNARLILNDDALLQAEKNSKYHFLLRLFKYEDCLDIKNSG